MNTRSEFGYEEATTDGISTQYSRANFLYLILQLKKDVVESLYNTANQQFLEFLASNRAEIESIASTLEPGLLGDPNPNAEGIMATAVEWFIPNWQTLQCSTNAVSLCDKLRIWANKWNLANRWCLDHAVITLQKQYLMSLDVAEHNIYDAWHDACIARRLDSICEHFIPNEAIQKKGLLDFNFEFGGISFSVRGPIHKSTQEFKQDVEREFMRADGPKIRCARKALSRKLMCYLQAFREIAQDQNLVEPSARWAQESHLIWLTYFQIPPDRKTITQLGKSFHKDRKSIRAGIDDVAKLIGLDLKRIDPATWKVRAGRPREQ